MRPGVKGTQTMENVARSITPFSTSPATPQIDDTDPQLSLPTGPTGRVHRGGGTVPWSKRCALTPAPSASSKLLLMVLASFVNGPDEAAWPSQKTLIELTGLSERGVRNATTQLEAAGLLRVEAGGGRQSSRYFLTTLTQCDSPRHSVPPTPALSAPEVPSEATKEVQEVQQRTLTKVSETPLKLAETGRSKLRSSPHTAQQRMVAAIAVKLDLPDLLTAEGLESFACLENSEKQALIKRLLRVEARYDRRAERRGSVPNVTPAQKKPNENTPVDPSSVTNVTPAPVSGSEAGANAPPAAKQPEKTKGKKQSPGANAPRAGRLLAEYAARLQVARKYQRSDGSWESLTS